jgi:hypothetical protein
VGGGGCFNVIAIIRLIIVGIIYLIIVMIMGRLIGLIRNGKYITAQRVTESHSNSAPFIHDDSMPPLRHLVSGQIFDSKSAYLRECDRLGLQVVGNDLLSKEKHQVKERVTEQVILDKIEKAESICSDPSKLRARQEENFRRLERYKDSISG